MSSLIKPENNSTWKPEIKREYKFHTGNVFSNISIPDIKKLKT
jgi:hypothetical protein